MPNAKVLSEKQAIVEALVERINAASAGILVDYQGITVAEDTALRTEMRKEGVDYTVVKNTLTRIAIDKVGMNELDPVLNGSTSMATSTEDPIAPFRIISDYSKKLGDKFNIKAAFMEGKILSEQEIAVHAHQQERPVLEAGRLPECDHGRPCSCSERSRRAEGRRSRSGRSSRMIGCIKH